MTILQLKDVTKSFGEGKKKVDALKKTTFIANKGELIAIVGPSGSGKSTFLTIAGGLQTPSTGDIMINNRVISQMKEKQRAKIRLEEIGFVLQASNLVPFLTVENQMKLINKVKKDNLTKEEMQTLYADLDIQELIKKYPADLSGGERQRVAIAKALYSKPSIILADEPTASLDSDRAYEVMEIFKKETKNRSTTTIVVTHDTRLLSYFDSVYQMTDGSLKLVQSNLQMNVSN
ncbi:MAG: ABC transporter ATP-binding protein [Bacillus sp. (in: firmicutes)]|mgnify:FL=1